MILSIHNALPTEKLDRIDALVEKVKFGDGRKTAHGDAAQVKNNQQAKESDPALKEIRNIVVRALMANDAFTSNALPLRMMAPMLNRYEVGMQYGDHIDLPIMTGNPPVRTDLAATLFLSPKDSYDGGELVISSDLGKRKVKLDRGGVVLYPATTTHRVEPVTRGVRLAVVTWVQSFVRHSEQRALLADLGRIESWAQKTESDGKATTQIRRVRSTLLRMWADV
jgi:PKHD-type hydroxylase